MTDQRALHLNCSDGSSDVVEIEAPHHVGPVEYAWGLRNDDDPTLLGVGPLSRTGIPGTGGLVLAGRSILWDGFYASSLPGAGLTMAALGFGLLVLRGRASQPAVAVIEGGDDDGPVRVRIQPIDPAPIWQQGGLGALVDHLASMGQLSASPNLQILATGPAAATSFGALCSTRFHGGKRLPVQGWFRRGGLGSRLLQVHNLCAVVLSSRRRWDEVVERSLPDSEALGFPTGLTTEQLAGRTRVEFNPRLLSWGDLGASLSARRWRVLWFNGASIYLSQSERDELYHRVLRDHFLSQLVAPLQREETHHSCGEACPLACKVVTDGGCQRDLEPYLALGPQLGVLDPAAVDELASHSNAMGFDALSVGSTLAWLMERLDKGLLDPQAVGVDCGPRWSATAFDAVADSWHNAELGRALLDGILASPWAEALRRGLRRGARAAGEPSAPLAIYNANGDDGEMAVPPYWAPGFYTPMPITGEYHQYYGIDFVPPRVLGRKSGQRMAVELMLQNFGGCRLHRGWAEEMWPDLINQLMRTSTDWAVHHHDLAKRIFRRRKARFWETERIVDIIATYLQDYQHDAAPDVELDRWVRRFREDRASAARAYWSEINAGMEEILGS